MLTALGRAKVLARSRSARTSTAGLLNAESAAFNDFTAQTLQGSVGHVGGDHLHEAEAARLAGMGILHDLALLDLAVLLEKAGNL